MIWRVTSLRTGLRTGRAAAGSAAAGPKWYRESRAAEFGLDLASAQAIVTEVEVKAVPEGANAAARRQFRNRLRMEELMLARACARGHDAAWEEFLSRYQPRLRQSARHITHESSQAMELADGLLADLFGMQTRDGRRVSKLNSYLGLGSLEGWLGALLAQAHVDQWRRERRWVTLDESAPLRDLLTGPNQMEATEATASPILRQQLEGALEAALGGASAPTRLLLNLYFLDGQTLAQIGVVLGVHESTVSRRLE